MLKKIPISYLLYITHLINAVIKFSYFPPQWKTAVIAPIKKPKKPPDIASSYRPISLLDTIAKITESFIAQLIKNHINEHNILISEQFGFRERHSATHQVYRLVEQITTGKANKQKTAAVFLDVSKAFDKVWINGLIYKLINYKFPPHLVHLIKSFLNNRNFHVKIKNALSDNYPCHAGVPQGSILAPTLYSIYTNDAPKYLFTNYATFADDTCIYAINHNRKYAIVSINKHLKLLSNYFHKWKIAINVDKTKTILFENISRNNRDKQKIILRNTPLPWSETAKYLGIELDRNLTFGQHIQKSLKKFREMKTKLYPLIAKNSELSTKNKLLLYNSQLRPLITYGCPVWAYAAKTHIKTLCRAQNGVIRQILNIPWYIYNRHIYKEIKTPRLRYFIQKLVINFHNNIPEVNNETLNNLAAYPLTQENRKRPRAALNLPALL